MSQKSAIEQPQLERLLGTDLVRARALRSVLTLSVIAGFKARPAHRPSHQRMQNSALEQDRRGAKGRIPLSAGSRAPTQPSAFADAMTKNSPQNRSAALRGPVMASFPASPVVACRGRTATREG